MAEEKKRRRMRNISREVITVIEGHVADDWATGHIMADLLEKWGDRLPSTRTLQRAVVDARARYAESDPRTSTVVILSKTLQRLDATIRYAVFAFTGKQDST